MKTPPINEILFLDIETVPNVLEFFDLPERAQNLYQRKFKHEFNADRDARAHYKEKAALYPEFSRIACVSIGKLTEQLNIGIEITLKSFISPVEREILIKLSPSLTADRVICGHNIKEFDLAFLGKRYLINGMTVPDALKVVGKKPWEIPHIDTMEMWRFGQFKGSCSLDLLAFVFGIPSPKTEMDGSKVADFFFAPKEGLPFEGEEERFKKITDYCEGDVITDANIFLRMNGLPLCSVPMLS